MGTKTGYLFDPVFLKHDHEGHVECAGRLECVMTGLENSGILSSLERIPGHEATIEELSLVHSLQMIDHIREISENGFGYFDADTYSTKFSFPAASVAAGGSADLALAVANGEIKNGFALVRPPGHHATPARPMGFCLFNNIALAAKILREKRKIHRIAIIDIDVHHGNGTQAVFDADPGLLFISTHQYPFYPGTGSIGQTGKGNAEGTKINLPLTDRAGDHSFDLLYREIIYPAVIRFNPEIILVSAGFDAHWQDPIAQLGLSLSGYANITRQLADLAGHCCRGKIAFFLEGGYNLNVLEHGVSNTFKILCGRNDIIDPAGVSPFPEPDLKEYVAKLKILHKL
ncbi:MAG: histone deacetylase [Bacteroidia bacterium]|nr:histone deacetylase [Bacteroidia bacterium]